MQVLQVVGLIHARDSGEKRALLGEVHDLGPGSLDRSITSRDANGRSTERGAHPLPHGPERGYRCQSPAPRRRGGGRDARQHPAPAGQVWTDPLVVWRRGQEEVLVRRVGERGQPVGQPYDHLLHAARDTFLQPTRVNGDAEGPGMRVRGGSAGHAVVRQRSVSR